MLEKSRWLQRGDGGILTGGSDRRRKESGSRGGCGNRMTGFGNWLVWRTREGAVKEDLQVLI